MNYRKKILFRVAMAVIFLCVIGFSMFNAAKHISALYAVETTEFYEARPLYHAVCFYANDGYIYTVSMQDAWVQIFGPNGDFIKGISVPAGGGALWTGSDSSENLYIYCIRTDVQVMISGEAYVVHENISYYSENGFFDELHITNANICERHGNSVTLNDHEGTKTVELSAPKDIFSVELCILIFIPCMIGLVVCSGILTRTAKEFDDKRQEYYRRNGKLKY